MVKQLRYFLVYLQNWAARTSLADALERDYVVLQFVAPFEKAFEWTIIGSK